MELEGCKEDEGEQATPLLQLPPLCTDWCVVGPCHAAGRLDSSYCLTKPFEYFVLFCLVSARTVLN
jgi:hypothetical protein